MCQSCGTQTKSGLCGCGTDCCAPWQVQPNCLHCPPPPSPPPCGIRINEDGTSQPVWHPVHPFLPYLWTSYRSALADLEYYYPVSPHEWAEQKERIDCQNIEIAEILRAIETETSTCTYGVKNYFKAISYQLLAHLELRELRRIWRGNLSALSSTGQMVDFSKAPALCNTTYGSMLERLKMQTRTISIMGI